MTLTTHLIVHDDYSHIASALDSLYQTTTPALVDAVIVTINSGPDPAIDDLHQQFPEVTFKLNRQPQGFAVNHNRILALSKSAYVALLNDDVILHEAALDRLVEYLEAHPDTALVGPYLQDPDGTPQVASYSDPSLFRMLYKVSGLAHLTSQRSFLRQILIRSNLLSMLDIASFHLEPTTREVPVIAGVVMIVRREAYQQVGPMDEATLAYGEEIDWCWRFRRAGWKVALVGESQVTHVGSGQTEFQLSDRLYVEDQKGILNYFIKHRPHWQIAVMRLGIVLLNLLRIPLSPKHAVRHVQAARIGLLWKP